MPETVARRYREGEENISTQHRDVSVIYAQLLGFEAFSRSLPSEESVSMLNSLVEAFDEAAERHGVEHVRSMQDTGLLATCGLVVPRIGHASRTIAFAKELAQIVGRFNDQHDAGLAIQVGIDSGPVTSGLVERSTIYALWGRRSTWLTGCMRRRSRRRDLRQRPGARRRRRHLPVHRGGHGQRRGRNRTGLAARRREPAAGMTGRRAARADRP